jgi:hypothetical protein
MSSSSTIPAYPQFVEISRDMRPALTPLFKILEEGISEFTFASIYLFRYAHGYKITKLEDDQIIISGRNGVQGFFMAPFGLPENSLLDELFTSYGLMKAVPEDKARELESRGYMVREDRNNFDYLYRTEELGRLQGRQLHRKKNLVNAFIRNYRYEGRPLLEEYIHDALQVLEEWRASRKDPADYEAAREGLERCDELVLCGGIYYVDGKPAGYTLGEEIAGGRMFVIHFEKALNRFKGLYQFVNMSFAAILPDKYTYVNREQDLGNEGLRQAKLSYKPAGFVKKYSVFRSN